MNKRFFFNFSIFILMLLVWEIFHIFTEWIFFITGFNFLSQISFLEQIGVLLLSVITFWPYIFVLVIPLFLILFLFNKINKFKFITKNSLVIVWNGCFSLTLVLLIDNFLYNVFNYKLQYQEIYGRVGYVLLYLCTCIFSFYFFLPAVRYWREANELKCKKILMILVFILSPVPLGTLFYLNKLIPTKMDIVFNNLTNKRPSIFLIAMDGVEAKYLSPYGGNLNLTPNLNEIVKESLVFDNAFTNSGLSYGASVALLTGKSPEKTKVSMHIATKLAASDQEVSFISMLDRLKYKLISSYFGYGKDFLSLNGVEYVETWMSDAQTSNFNSEIIVRVLSIANFITGKINVNTIDLDPNQKRRISNSTTSFDKSFETIKAFIENNNQDPLLVHIHMMFTHVGVNFNKHKVYTVGQTYSDDNWLPFYYDAIIESDRYIGELFEHLKKNDMWNKSIIVFYSDHGRHWNPRKRVPLMIRFPNGEHHGRVNINSQLLDIAPTITEYMGIPLPKWYDGLSHIGSHKIDENRPIYSVTGKSEGKKYWFEYGMIKCEYYFGFNLEQNIQEEIEGHTNKCSNKSNLDSKILIPQLVDHFTKLKHQMGVVNIDDILQNSNLGQTSIEKLTRRMEKEEKVLIYEQKKKRSERAFALEIKKQKLERIERAQKIALQEEKRKRAEKYLREQIKSRRRAQLQKS